MRGCMLQRHRGTALGEKNMKNLTASSREKTGKGNNRRLRAEGDMPAVIYGGEGEALSLSLSSHALTRALRGENRRNTLIGLEIDGADAQPVLLRELQADPVTRDLVHADFIRVDLKTAVTIKVPVEMTGKAKGALLGGRMRMVRRVVDISCLPENIPASFAVEISDMDGGDSIRYSACPSADGITKVFRNDYVVVQCVKGREARQEDADETAEPAAEA
jgi:large subunit ribosomal protein L25